MKQEFRGHSTKPMLRVRQVRLRRLHFHPVDLDLTLLAPLYKRAREIYDLSEAPAGREGRKDCERLENLLALVSRSSP